MENFNNSELLSKVSGFPATPGVYLMKDKTGRVIYVGKAKCLKVRVRQYFGTHDSRYHVLFLMKRVVAIDFIETKNESEALLLENSLIKKHKPRYNMFLKDDKTYQGVKITMSHAFPRLIPTRKIKKDGALYYGPFTSSDSLYQVKAFIDQYLKLRTCNDHEFNNRTRPCLEYQIKRCSAPCVGYVTKEEYAAQIASVKLFLEGKNKNFQKLVTEEMKQAAAAENFEDAARLRDLLASMNVLLEGQSVTQLSFEFTDILAVERRDDKIGVAVLMVRDAHLIDSRYYVFNSLEEDREFLQNFITQYYTENSFIPREILVPETLLNDELITDLLKERSGHDVVLRLPKRTERRELFEMAKQNLSSHFSRDHQVQIDKKTVLERLKTELKLDNFPERMECYDISNISGEFAVGSLVSFVDGEKFSAGYRHFNIKTVVGPNDFAMLKEVFLRRFKREESDWIKPDLIVVDGGKGQLAQALKVFEELDIVGVDVVSIAKGKGEGARAKGLWKEKKEEEIYIPGRKNPVILRRGSPELMLLQNIRDEAHRFAIEHHRKKRDRIVR